MTIAVPKHPAKFSDSILGVLRDEVLLAEVSRRGTFVVVLDPMAGVGRIHELADDYIHTCGVELEPEWAAANPKTQQGDATNLPPEWTGAFHAVVTSPPYGNRMADHHHARDDSRRMTYKHQLGRDLTEDSGAGLQWGVPYREFGRNVISEMVRVCAPGGIVVVNISNHIRGGEEMPVAEWWLARLLVVGLQFERAIPVETPRMGFGANAKTRVDREWVFVTRKPANG